MSLELTFLLAILVYHLVAWALLSRMSKRHEEAWHAAGSPTLWMPVSRQLRFLRYMFGLKSFRLGDPWLIVLTLLFFALYAFLLGSFVVLVWQRT